MISVTLIAAYKYTKNKIVELYPEVEQIKKDIEWYYCIVALRVMFKIFIDSELDTGLGNFV